MYPMKNGLCWTKTEIFVKSACLRANRMRKLELKWALDCQKPVEQLRWQCQCHVENCMTQNERINCEDMQTRSRNTHSSRNSNSSRKAFVDMSELCISAALNGIETTYTCLQENNFETESAYRKDAGDVMLRFLNEDRRRIHS